MGYLAKVYIIFEPGSIIPKFIAFFGFYCLISRGTSLLNSSSSVRQKQKCVCENYYKVLPQILISTC